MKNLVKTIMATALTVLAVFAHASESFSDFEITVVGEKMFKLSVENVLGKAEISLLDQEGAILFESEETSTKINKQFDLSLLPEGTYELRYQDEFKIQKVSLIISKQLEFDLLKESVQFVPVISQKDNMVNVGFLTNSTSQMSISVYDGKDDLLYNQTVKGDDYFGKRLDFSELRKGSYKVVIAAEGKIYSKMVRI